MADNFHAKCYALLRQIPPGRVSTYKIIAHQLGSKAYRAVGQAMHRNPHMRALPCHRVVGSDGQLRGYVAGVSRKADLLQREGITVVDGRVKNLNHVLYRFED